MRHLTRNLLHISFLVVLVPHLATAAEATARYHLKPLFELQTGGEANQFLLSFALAPFAPVEGQKSPLTLTGTRAVVDNSGNFYLLKERRSIAKINSEGEVIGQIAGVRPFTVPMEMKLDRDDHLYVMFRHDTNVADEYRYAVARFNKKGDVVYWIGDKGEYNCIHMTVSINGNLFLRTCGSGKERQIARFDENGQFTGAVEQAEDKLEQMTDNGGSTHFRRVRNITIEGADSNIYVVNEHDLTVRKYPVHGGDFTTIEGIEFVAERQLFPWVEVGGKPKFQGFDTHNDMYFYFGHWKREELPQFFVDVAVPSDTLKCCRYDFDADHYDTLTCYSAIQEEGKFMTRRILRNHIGELYEVVIFFNDPPNVTPQDHVRFYKWHKVE